MNWASWSELFAMGGYALYVWGSYVVAFILIALELVLHSLRWRAILQHLGVLERGIS